MRRGSLAGTLRSTVRGCVVTLKLQLLWPRSPDSDGPGYGLRHRAHAGLRVLRLQNPQGSLGRGLSANSSGQWAKSLKSEELLIRDFVDRPVICRWCTAIFKVDRHFFAKNSGPRGGIAVFCIPHAMTSERLSWKDKKKNGIRCQADFVLGFQPYGEYPSRLSRNPGG